MGRRPLNPWMNNRMVRYSRSLWLLALVSWSLCPLPGRAAKVKVWHQHSPAHYDKAAFRHAVLSSEGTLRLSRQLKPLATLDASHVWDMVEDRDGNLIVATGD